MALWQPILGGNGAVDVSDGLEGHMFASRGSNDYGPPPEQWTTVDVRSFGIPSDAVCIDISGILIVTMGATGGFCNLCVTFRRPGDARVGIHSHYSMQTLANTSDGARSNSNTVISLVDGKFEWAWWHSGCALGWPEAASVALNLTITRWMR